jgi:hypothetical protein
MRLVMTIFGFLAAIVLVPAAALAGAYDGSSGLICASLDTAHCVAEGECATGRAASVNLPQFFKIDFEAETIRAERPDGSERSSPIEITSHDQDHLVLQGVQEGLGWSVVIDETTGHMTIAASGHGEAFIVFGACTLD